MTTAPKQLKIISTAPVPAPQALTVIGYIEEQTRGLQRVEAKKIHVASNGVVLSVTELDPRYAQKIISHGFNVKVSDWDDLKTLHISKEEREYMGMF